MIYVDFQLITMVQTIKDMAKGILQGELIDLVDEELVSNERYPVKSHSSFL